LKRKDFTRREEDCQQGQNCFTKLFTPGHSPVTDRPTMQGNKQYQFNKEMTNVSKISSLIKKFSMAALVRHRVSRVPFRRCLRSRPEWSSQRPTG